MKNLQDVLHYMEELPSFVGMNNIDVSSVGIFGDTPLHVAVLQNDLEAIELIVGAGGDVNAAGEEGYSPLHEAVEQGNDAAAHLLLKLGASVNIKNSNGYTPYDLAVMLDNSIASHLCDESIKNT
jgi:uncharacterized protein